ncbi:MAG: YiiX/YebB-like N1pC/P60 family cysteine hydrolase [Dysgonomonas sp.]|nr:YiiX/YebB-like N1pC/P60 family cysteine hydrolase [Dysgonomonas sp.]
MQYFIHLFFTCISLFSTNSNDKFTPQNGDLIFQESCEGNMGEAIKDVTSGIAGYNFTHVGIVWVSEKNDSIYVIEATHPKVCMTPLQEYLYPKDKNCPPISVVARLKDQYQPLIPQAIEEAKNHIGKDYDDAFDLKNDLYYCSELIYDILLKANSNTPIFPLNIMTFKSKDSDNFSPNWISHFEKQGIPIPEGELGINPGAMSKQKEIIDIVYFYQE